MWPLRGIRRVAVIGGGDSAKCAVESLLGIAPPPVVGAAALDHVDRVDWYSRRLPTTCEGWQQDIRGRYQSIGRYLRPDRRGVQRLTVIPRRAQPVALPGLALIDGRSYDLVVVCTGNRETNIRGLIADLYELYDTSAGTAVARQDRTLPVFRIGPHARLPFTQQEREDGIADIAENVVSIARTATKTATLAVTLPQQNWPNGHRPSAAAPETSPSPEPPELEPARRADVCRGTSSDHTEKQLSPPAVSEPPHPANPRRER
jgi:hypothetical protein